MKRLWLRMTRKRYKQGVHDAFKHVLMCLDAVDGIERHVVASTPLHAVTSALRGNIKQTKEGE